jgi:cbb3-type cytochrome oxidase subunit 3
MLLMARLTCCSATGVWHFSSLNGLRCLKRHMFDQEAYMILYLNQDTRTDTIINQASQDSRSTMICRSVGKKNDVCENVDDPNPNPTDVYSHCPSRFTVLDVHVTSLYMYFLYHGGTIGVLIVKAYTFESPYHIWVKLSTRRKKSASLQPKPCSQRNAA